MAEIFTSTGTAFLNINIKCLGKKIPYIFHYKKLKMYAFSLSKST